jgi:hypothetical protein
VSFNGQDLLQVEYGRQSVESYRMTNARKKYKVFILYHGYIEHGQHSRFSKSAAVLPNLQVIQPSPYGLAAGASLERTLLYLC